MGGQGLGHIIHTAVVMAFGGNLPHGGARNGRTLGALRARARDPPKCVPYVVDFIVGPPVRMFNVYCVCTCVVVDEEESSRTYCT